MGFLSDCLYQIFLNLLNCLLHENSSLKSQVSRLGLCLVVSFSVFFCSCQHDIAVDDTISPTTVTSPKVETSFITIEKAKAYYDSQIEMLKREGAKVRDNTTTDATFNGLDGVPLWDSARIVNKNSISFVEVPFTFTDGQHLASSISPNSQANPTQRSASCLLVSANSQGAMTSSFMSVTADNAFLSDNGTLGNFSYNSVPTQFKGVEMHYGIRGNFINGWHFKQGKIDGRVERTRNNGVHLRDCYSQSICYEVERYTIQVGNYALRTIVMDCSYSFMVGFCNGWFDYENNSGGGGNSWGGNIDNEWGDSCDGTCQETAVMRNIVDHLTHPCLSGVLSELQQNHMVPTLRAFNDGRIPNLSLNFQEGSLSDIAQTTGNNRSYSITLDYNKLSSATDLFVAMTIVHESIHAYITMDVTVLHPRWLSDYILRNNLPSDTRDYDVLIKAYAEGKNPNDADHLQMMSTYVNYIRDILLAYGSCYEDGEPTRFTEICTDLAWAGLPYESLPSTTMTETTKTRIRNRIKAELKNETFGNQTPRGRTNCN